MQVTTNNYSDFVTSVKSVSSIDTVLFWDDSPNTFTAYAIFAGGNIVGYAGGLSSKPGSFDDDFPDAVELTANFSVSG